MKFDRFNHYYQDCIGVTKSPGQKDCEVIFWIEEEHAPYIITNRYMAARN